MTARQDTIGARTIALFEGTKVLLALFALIELLSGHWKISELAQKAVDRFSIDPDGHVGTFLLKTVGTVSPGLIIGLLIAYGIVRSVQIYGLWREREWGEWLTVAATSLYVPLEIYELIAKVTPLRIGILCANVAIILFMLHLIRSKHRSRHGASA